MLNVNTSTLDRSVLSLVGGFAEVTWVTNNKLAARQCEKCVYLVRGAEYGMLCVELVYDAIEGRRRNDAIYWVPTTAVQSMRVLSEKEANRRIETLEREAVDPSTPRD